jgi:hypothetical protein
MIGWFDEKGFKTSLCEAMNWRQREDGPADRVAEHMVAWFDEHQLIQLPCRDVIQAPEKLNAVVACRCGRRYRLHHEPGRGWEATLT